MFKSVAKRCGAAAVGAQRRNVSAQAITFDRQGAVDMVLKSGTVKIGESLAAKEVLVKMVAAPVSPLDIIAVEGKIPGTGKTGIAGNGGVGIVEQVGSSVSKLKKGDRVVPSAAGMGTWATYAVASEENLMSVPKGVSDEQAALLGAGPATALRVLDGVNSGEGIVIDGGNTQVGMALVQIASAKGIKVASIVSSNVVDFKGVSAALKKAGSAIVVDESSATSKTFLGTVSDLKPKLAIHCDSSSKTASVLAKALSPGGTVVSVAGAGAVNVPSSVLIDGEISVKGFNLEKSIAADKGASTFSELVKMVEAGKLAQPVAASEKLDNFKSAIDLAAVSNGAVLFKM